jgi:hypothetical protein
MVLHDVLRMIFVPHRKHTYGPPRPVTGQLLAVVLLVLNQRCRWPVLSWLRSAVAVECHGTVRVPLAAEGCGGRSRP